MKPYKCRKHGFTEAYDYLSSGRRVRKCKLCRAEQVKEEWRRLKSEVIAAYGGKCECCKETIYEFLTIDHINGNGKEHRKTIGRGYKLYKWLKRNNFPKEGFRLLCFNCNCARGQYGECPHRREKK